MSCYYEATRQGQTNTAGGHANSFTAIAGSHSRHPRRILAARQTLQALCALEGDHAVVMRVLMDGGGRTRHGEISPRLISWDINRDYYPKHRRCAPSKIPVARVHEILDDLRAMIQRMEEE